MSHTYTDDNTNTYTNVIYMVLLVVSIIFASFVYMITNEGTNADNITYSIVILAFLAFNILAALKNVLWPAKNKLTYIMDTLSFILLIINISLLIVILQDTNISMNENGTNSYSIILCLIFIVLALITLSVNISTCVKKKHLYH